MTALRDRLKAVLSAPGRSMLRIEDLIVPYRFDILIRRRMIRLLIDQPTLDSGALLEAAAEVGYTAWFDEIEIDRFRPELKGASFRSRRKALLERLSGLRDLLTLLERSEFRLTTPLVLNWYPSVAITDSGQSRVYGIAVGDGCHRVAALSNRGERFLVAGQYRLRPRVFRRVLDNTAVLLARNRICREDVARAFASEHVGFRAALLDESDGHPRTREFRQWIEHFLSGNEVADHESRSIC